MDEPAGFEFEKLMEKDAPVQEDPSKRFAFKAIHKKVVCRYWLNNCCKKGDTCEFLHSFDEERMPECRKGSLCGDPSCFLKHPTKDDKPVCPNFAAGFCSLGHSCQWRHDILETPPPSVAQLFLADDPAKVWIAARRKGQRSFRTAPCPYFQNDGWCPYFLSCAFSHENKPVAPHVPPMAYFPPLPQRPLAPAPRPYAGPPPPPAAQHQYPFQHQAPVMQHQFQHPYPVEQQHYAPQMYAPRPQHFQQRHPQEGAWRGRGGFKRGHSRGPRDSSAPRPPPSQRARLETPDAGKAWGDMV